jgi:hypothetical protein
VFCNLFLLQNKVLAAVLPDGMFSNQKSKFGHILEGLANEDVGIFSALLSILSILQQMLYFMAIWCIYLVVFWYIFPVLVCCTEKNLATLIGRWREEENVKATSPIA